MSTPTSSSIVARLVLSQTATFVIGEQSVILLANPASGRLLGFEPREVIGQALDLPHSPDEEKELEMVCAQGAVRKIRIVSRPVDWNGKSAFEVELHPVPDPVVAPVASPAASPAAPAAPAAGAGPGGQRVLILEDDLSIGDIQCRMLKTLGYVTVWTKTGEETIERCKESVAQGQKFAVALLDLTIHGGMGGREVVRHLCRIDPELKPIACSGYSDEDLNRELLKEGFIDILPKPFRAQELGKILKKNLG